MMMFLPTRYGIPVLICTACVYVRRTSTPRHQQYCTDCFDILSCVFTSIRGAPYVYRYFGLE